MMRVAIPIVMVLLWASAEQASAQACVPDAAQRGALAEHADYPVVSVLCDRIVAFRAAHPSIAVPTPSFDCATELATQCQNGSMPQAAAAIAARRPGWAGELRVWAEDVGSASERVARTSQLCAGDERQSLVRFRDAHTGDPSIVTALDSILGLCVADRAAQVPAAVDVRRLESAIRQIRGGRLDVAQLERDAVTASAGEVRGNLAIPGLAAIPDLDQIAQIVIEGLAQFLVSRAEAEVRTFIVQRIRDEVCTPAAGACEGDAALAGECLSARLLESTCAFIASSDFRFRAELGESFQAVALADVLALPRVALDIAPAATTQQIRALRMALTLVVSVLDATSPADVMVRVAEEAERAATYAEEWAEAASIARVVAIVAEEWDRAGHAPNEGGATAPAAPSESELVQRVQLALGAELTGAQRARVRAVYRHVRDATIAIAGLDRAIRQPIAGDDGHGREDDDDEGGDDGDESEHDASSAGADAARARIEGQLAAARRLVSIVVLLTDDVLVISGREPIPSWVGRALDDVLSGQPSRMLRAGLAALTHLLEAQGSTEQPLAIRVLELGVELAGAEDADEAAQVLDAFAAPVGSWQGKLERPMVSLSGLVGVGGGWEQALPSSSTALGTVGGTFSLVGLFGVDATTPIDHAVSLGGFFSILDIGALVTASGMDVNRTNGADTTLEISPLQFLGPGVFARLGLGSTPLVLGFGLEVMPWGRSVRYTVGDVEHTDYVPVWRGQAFLAVDVTILPF